MSDDPTPQPADAGTPNLSAEEVIDYLKAYPDFFERYPEVIEILTLKHDSGAASLLERQLELLREKNRDLSSRIETLISTVRANENSSFALHRFSLALLQSLPLDNDATACLNRIDQIEQACQRVLHKAFPDVQMILHWFREFVGDVDGISLIARGEPRIAGLARRIFADGRPDCGPFDAAERVVLFSEFNQQFSSAVVVPLSVLGTGESMGLLVLTSRDHDKFVSGKGTIFLTLLKQLIEYFLFPRSSA